MVCATTQLHALLGWSFVKMVAAKCGVVLTSDQLARINQWSDEEQRCSDLARDQQQRITQATRACQLALQRVLQQRSHDALLSSRKPEPGHSFGYQPLQHTQALECMCFFTPFLESSQSSAAASTPKPRWMCTLCNNVKGTGDRAGHNKGSTHRSHWDDRESIRLALERDGITSSSSSSSSASIPHYKFCNCR